MTTQPIHFGRNSKHGRHTHAGSFGNRAIPVRPGPGKNKQHAQLVKQAEKLVSQTFYGQMLKQMRDSPFKDKMFSGGRGGEAFGEMFDQQLADRMSKGAGGGLVDAIANKLEQNKAAGAYHQQPRGGMTSPAKSAVHASTFTGVA